MWNTFDGIFNLLLSIIIGFLCLYQLLKFEVIDALSRCYFLIEDYRAKHKWANNETSSGLLSSFIADCIRDKKPIDHILNNIDEKYFLINEQVESDKEHLCEDFYKMKDEVFGMLRWCIIYGSIWGTTIYTLCYINDMIYSTFCKVLSFSKYYYGYLVANKIKTNK